MPPTGELGVSQPLATSQIECHRLRAAQLALAIRAFDVTAVPTMVVSSSDFTPCDGLTCKTTPPPFDRIEGNVTVRYALETFAGENGPGALIARTALANLGRNP